MVEFFHPGLVDIVGGSVFGFHSYLVKERRVRMGYPSADVNYFGVTVQWKRNISALQKSNR